MNELEIPPQQAYKLQQDLDRMEDYPPELREEWGIVDVKLIGEFADNHKFRRTFYKPEPINSVNEIRMEGFLSDFEGIDYIYTEPRLPIMSKRMLSVLRSVQDFLHQTIPVIIEDTEAAKGDWFRSSGKINTNYVALQLLEQLDIFDKEKSVYDTEVDSDEIESIDELVLKVPSEGLPPIFRITVDPISLYVSPEAKTALEEAGITGIRFVPID